MRKILFIASSLIAIASCSSESEASLPREFNQQSTNFDRGKILQNSLNL